MNMVKETRAASTAEATKEAMGSEEEMVEAMVRAVSDWEAEAEMALVVVVADQKAVVSTVAAQGAHVAEVWEARMAMVKVAATAMAMVVAG